ncbi:hypothetical protein ACFYE2_15935 [Kocuria sp. CPCC 205300]|uniref:hypothetical protein n=1 Tax=Kocuria sabuli TaxID=3071448 RepID=UPI0036D8E2B0
MSTEGIDDAGSSGAPRERRPFRWWWIPAYFAVSLFLDTVGEAVWDRVVAIGGYGLSNAVAGLVALTVCFVFYARTRARHRKLEDEGDPEPLPTTTDYVTTAMPTVVLSWMAGLVAWAVTVMLLVLLGPSSAWVLGPVVGTAFMVGARMESSHAKVMEARRRMPPAPATPPT